MEIRKLVTVVEETRRELGRAVEPPARQAAAIAVIANPYAGVYDEALEELQQAGAELGALLVQRAIDALGISGDEVASYGKAAIVGVAGEREHAAAVMHPRMGKPVREIVGPARSIMPSTKKLGGPGTVIDCPLHHKDEMWTFSHFDAMQVSVTDAPRADEIVVVVAVADSGRPFHRVGEDLAVADLMSKNE
ncbi:MAG: amino acid synthesis family protein [Defluviicoccus sp.]|nr:amino acid synthesis family protein [Defluviicoccus sp.]